MNLNNFLNPKSIAIIGASNDEKKIGYQITYNIISNGFKGDVFPINLKDGKILGLKAYTGIKLVRKKIDLALVVIPAEFVADEVEKCADLGIKNIIIVSAGFSESGGVGRLREVKIKELALKYDLNILGPNCFGIINTANNLNATFANSKNKRGRVAFISQSGAICSSVLDWAGDKNFGFSKFISIGNKAVLDENDFFEEMINDKGTDLVVAYLEDIKDGQKFMEVVSRLSKIKPVAILKAGQSAAGATAALSHTGSMAGSNEAVMAGFRRADVIILDNIEEMFNLLLFFDRKRSFQNDKIAIVSNAGGVLVSTVDLLSRKGLSLEALPSALKRKMESELPPIVNVKNPLDIIGDASSDRYKIALNAILASGYYAITLVLLTPQSSTDAPQTSREIVSLAKKYKNRMIFASFIGGDSVYEARRILSANGVINFDFPNKTVDLLAKLLEYKKKKTSLKIYKKNTAAMAQPVKKNEQMDYMSSLKLLLKYGIKIVKTVKIKNESDLIGLDFPIALKVVGKKLIHKTDQKAIALNLKNREAAIKAFVNFKKLLSDKGNYCVAQPMGRGLEMIAGFKRDDSFGPIIMAGMGGIYAEILKDIKTETGDIDIKRAQLMLQGLKMYPILKGARGHNRYDINGVVKLLVNLSRLGHNNPKIQEMDINPLFVTEEGVFAADVRIIC